MCRKPKTAFANVNASENVGIGNADDERPLQPDDTSRVNKHVEIDRITDEIRALQRRLSNLVDDNDKIESIFHPESSRFDYDEWQSFFDDMAASAVQKISSHVALTSYSLPDVDDSFLMRMLSDLVLLKNSIANLLLRLRNGRLLRFTNGNLPAAAYKHLSDVNRVLVSNRDAFDSISTAAIGSHYLALLRDTQQRIEAIRRSLPEQRRLYEAAAHSGFHNSRRKLDSLYRRIRNSQEAQRREASQFERNPDTNANGHSNARQNYSVSPSRANESDMRDINEPLRKTEPDNLARVNVAGKDNETAPSIPPSACHEYSANERRAAQIQAPSRVPSRSSERMTASATLRTSNSSCGRNRLRHAPASNEQSRLRTFVNSRASEWHPFPADTGDPHTIYVHYPTGRQPYYTYAYPKSERSVSKRQVRFEQNEAGNESC
jgi:hypothetical protein